MILLENRKETAKATLSQLLLGNKNEKSNAFGKMLEELSLSRTDGKAFSKDELALLLTKKEGGTGPVLLSKEENAEAALLKEGSKGPLLLNLDDAQKPQASLSTLLHGKEEIANELLPEEQQDIEMLHPKITRELPLKELRTLIQEAKTYLKEQISQITDIKELPKTLKGLMQLAQKIGIEIEKITLEQVPAKGVENALLKIGAPGDQEQRIIQLSEQLKTSARNIPVEHTTAQLVETKQERKTKEQSEQKPELLRTLLQPDKKSDTKSDVKSDMKFDAKTEHKHSGPVPGDIKSTLPVQAQSATQESVTQPLRQPLFASALNQLLQGSGEEVSLQQNETAPATEQGGNKTTQALSGIAKSEPVLLKINEAKETIRHFAGEIKEAVQNYKPPFTRIQIQLNPGKLGEVDVTMVQRGNNVHINISSNSAAINTLAQNATELKTQLAQNGLNNATMNFSSSNGSEQQQQQQRQHLAELYEQFENNEEFTLYEQLELIVPRYV